MKRSLFLFSACAVLTASALSFRAAAQIAPPSSHATPSPEQMIEQLKAPRTRSLRNLTVEAASPTAATSTLNTATVSVVATPLPPATPEPRPSLSLLIQFDFDSARVRPVSQEALANLALALKSKELQDSKFAIEGHTDARGRSDYNLRLSQQRADAVSQLLVSQGVAQERLQAVGKGSAELANRADPQAAENRRVQIVNLD